MLQDSAEVQACTLLATLAYHTISIEAAVDKVQRRAAWSWRELQLVTAQLTQFDSVDDWMSTKYPEKCCHVLSKDVEVSA